MKPTTYIWKNGEMVLWEMATTHVLTHGLHYGSGVFEGIRAYSTDQGPAIFRAKEHYDRLMISAAYYHMTIPYSVDDLIDATTLLIHKNDLDSCYIRPISYYGYGSMGILPRDTPIDTVIACWEWGAYLGEEGLQHGIRCIISDIVKFDDRAMPTASKCTANYANACLAKTAALESGYDEALLLNHKGTVAEGPGENLFLIKDGQVFSPPVEDGALPGITVDSVRQLMGDLDIPFSYKSLTKEDLFDADELFFTGTAAEVTPIRELNDRSIGSGIRGPLTERIQSAYFDCVNGKNDRYKKWLTFIN